MTRWKSGWIYLLGAVIVCVVVTSAVEAQCAKCIQPPGEPWQCGNTFYNAANGCEVGPGWCRTLGSCEGQLGDACEVDPRKCTFDQWTCGRPLGEEWRLESYTVKHRFAGPASAGAKTGKDKA